MKQLLQSKYTSLFVAFLAFAAVIIAVTLQQAWTIYPCTLCISQRYLFLLMGSTAVLRAATPRFQLFWRVQQGLIGVAGMGFAVKNIYVQLVPSPSCGRDRLAEFLNGLPMASDWPAVFQATGMCSDPIPPVMGVPFPVWSLLLFLALTIVVLFKQK